MHEGSQLHAVHTTYAHARSKLHLRLDSLVQHQQLGPQPQPAAPQQLLCNSQRLAPRTSRRQNATLLGRQRTVHPAAHPPCTPVLCRPEGPCPYSPLAAACRGTPAPAQDIHA